MLVLLLFIVAFYLALGLAATKLMLSDKSRGKKFTNTEIPFAVLFWPAAGFSLFFDQVSDGLEKILEKLGKGIRFLLRED